MQMVQSLFIIGLFFKLFFVIYFYVVFLIGANCIVGQVLEMSCNLQSAMKTAGLRMT